MKNTSLKIRILIITFLWLSINNIASARIEAIIGSLPLEKNPNLFIKTETSNPEIIISREQYIISYNKLRRTPNWVAWKLESDQLGNSGRSNNFKQDADLENYLTQSTSSGLHAVNQTEYKGSCFDRGHIIPSADRTDNPENNQTTFLMSNMTPQTPYLNRVIWAHLEQYTRDNIQNSRKTAYVISGPIYTQDFGKIGPNNDIAVPSGTFKIIFFLKANQVIEDINSETETVSVIMPNTLQDGTIPTDKTKLCKPLAQGPLDRNDWIKYKAPINQIEKLSGIKFTFKGDL